MTNQAAEENGADCADDRFAVKVRGNQAQINQLLREGEVDIGDHPNIADNRDGTGSLDAFLTSLQIETLRADGYDITVGENISAQARVRLAEVGKDDRFDGGRAAQEGLGRKVGGNLGPKGEAKP